jgi:hypothetical protein
MKLSHIITLSFLSTLAGIAFLSYEHEWIIIRSPWNMSEHSSTPGLSKQKIVFSYWCQHAWKEEAKELIITDEPEKRVATIIANWLTMLHEEKIIKEKVVLESALFDPANTRLYISFDQTPFGINQSTHEKWMFIQGLMRTLKENQIQLQGIYFLVNHAPLQDDQLDFTNPWPV